ncbi:DMT family transporter [Bacillus sp. DJP31]|uniref:DMT family transporter n=1 Tax=Bacillus sp. DJP31 TaxID=3409789 RepID=UPI003BB595EB
MKLLMVLIAVIGGILAGTQAPINGELGRRIGSLEAALVSFFIGTLVLTLFVLFFGKGQLPQALSVPKWQLLGGILGATFVTAIIFCVPNLGVATTIFSAIIGQVIISMVIDHFGLFGITRNPVNLYRLIGVILMISSLFFIYKGTVQS